MSQVTESVSTVLGINHVSLIVQDADDSLSFYQELLGLNCVERPNLGFPGYWLDLSGGQTLHLMEMENPYSGVERPEHGGRDVHFALSVRSVDSFLPYLDKQGIAYTRSRSGRAALFIRDPDKNAFELVQVKGV